MARQGRLTGTALAAFLLGLLMAVAEWPIRNTQVLAQISPNQVTGQLQITTSPDIYPEFSLPVSDFNAHPFEGNAGESIRIELTNSEVAVPYLVLLGPDGRRLEEAFAASEDEDTVHIVVTLPVTGSYDIIATAFFPDIGQYRYTLTWQAVPTIEANQFAARRQYQRVLYLAEAGRYGEAISLAEESLNILQTAVQDNISINMLLTLGSLYTSLGRYSEAESSHLEALALRRERNGESSIPVVNSLGSLASLYRVQGRYNEAELLYLQVLALRRQALGDRHLDVVDALNGLASLYLSMGRYSEVEPLLKEALDISQNQTADLFNNFFEAIEAIESSDDYPLDETPEVAESLSLLASLYIIQGRPEEAEPLLSQTLAIYQEEYGNGHPDIAITLNGLAALFEEQRRYDEAETYYLQALAMMEELGETPVYVIDLLYNLAKLYHTQGRYGEALVYLKRALDLQERNLSLNLTALAEAQRQNYAATLFSLTNSAIALHLQFIPDHPEAQTLALTTVLRRKGHLLDAGVNSLSTLRQNLSPEEQRLFDQFTDKRRALAALTFNRPPEVSTEQYQAAITQLEVEINTLEGELARRSAAFRADSQPLELTTVQAQIPDRGVLVEYVRYLPFDALTAQEDFAHRYAVYLLFPNGRIEAVDLGDAAEIDAAVQEFSLRLRDITQSPSAFSRELSAQILDPIQPYLTGREQLLISPDSQLNRIPFEALRSNSGDYLIEQFQISYLNSGRDLLKFDVMEPSQQPAVIVANPDYEVADASIQIASTRSSQRSVELSQLQFGPLPGTAAEAEAIRPLLPNAVVLTESEATENAIKQVQAPEILHIATHGFFLENVARSEVENVRGLGIVAGDSPVTQSPTITVENPLLRSGLALAGFNERESGGEDGVLTALEAAQLNLFGTQLVVLSACETGLGDIANGEGVYGLRRAFAIAGAETQLMSLWQVDDFGTQSLMAHYYENLTAGMGRSESLRQVQLELINSRSRYAHPFYWAAFIITGDWRPLE